MKWATKIVLKTPRWNCQLSLFCVMLFSQYFKGMLFGIYNTSLFDSRWCLVKFRLYSCGLHIWLPAYSHPWSVYGDTQCYTRSTENELLIRTKLFLCCCCCLRWRCDYVATMGVVINLSWWWWWWWWLQGWRLFYDIVTSHDKNGDSDDNYTTFITRFILVEVIYSEPSTTLVLNIKDIH